MKKPTVLVCPHGQMFVLDVVADLQVQVNTRAGASWAADWDARVVWAEPGETRDELLARYKRRYRRRRVP